MPTRVSTLLLILEPLLRALCTVAAVLFIFRSLRHRLLARYWLLTLFLASEILEWTVPAAVGVSSSYLVYRVGDLVKLLFSVAFLWSLAKSVFARFPAISTFASKSSKLIVALCLLFGWVSFLTDPTPPPGRSPELHLWISLNRAVTSGLLLFMIAVAVFASWFPVRMPRNLARIVAGFLLWLGISWIGYLASNHAATLWGNVAYDAVVLGILTYWITTVNAAGEIETAGTLPQWDRDRLDRVTTQLSRLESNLARRGY